MKYASVSGRDEPMENDNQHDQVSVISYPKRRLLRGNVDGTIKIYCLNTDQILAYLRDAHQDCVICFEILNSSLFASCSSDGTIKIWSLHL